MDMLSHLLADDPASPRLTVYNEADGTRMDFSAQTTENWASKVANFLREELDLDDGSAILVDLPVSWQTVMISLGALAAGVTVHFATDTVAADSSDTSDAAEPVVFFTTTDKASEYANRGDVVVVTTDPFGRGVEELGQQVPEGAVDFGPTVRFTAISTLGKPAHWQSSLSRPSSPTRSACCRRDGQIQTHSNARFFLRWPREVLQSWWPAW